MTAASRKKFHKQVQRPFRWQFRQEDRALADHLVRIGGLPPLVARILAARAHELAPAREQLPTQLEAFLEPKLGMIHDPFLLADMDTAVERVIRALRKGEKLVVYGDYDSDGTSATALLVELFRFLGHDVRYYIPHRLGEGYGLNAKALRQLAAQGFTCVVTVDNGVTAIEEAEIAKKLGLDLVITDHHRPGAELPRAAAVVNPNRRDCPYPFKFLAGVGVAFKFAHALLKKWNKVPVGQARAFLNSVLDLVAIGTVADCVPLIGENRIFVAKALPRMRNPDNVRLAAMAEVWDLPKDRLGAQTISFRIAPRLNAAGRTDHAGVCVELLTAHDMNRARRIAGDLEALNEERRDLESWLLRECLYFVDNEVQLEDEPILVVDGEGWHIGVLGIVASRLSDLYCRPTIVIARQNELGQGSGRSPEAFNLHDALSATSEYLLEWGGHAHAAGLRLATNKIRRFREAINEYAHRCLDPDTLVPQLILDTEIAPEELNEALLDSLEKLEPFGEGNPTPILAMRHVRLLEPPRIVGGNHLKLRVGQGRHAFDAIGFQLGSLRDFLMQHRHSPLDVAFSPSADTFTGTRKVTMELKDLRVTGA